MIRIQQSETRKYRILLKLSTLVSQKVFFRVGPPPNRFPWTSYRSEISSLLSNSENSDIYSCLNCPNRVPDWGSPPPNHAPSCEPGSRIHEQSKKLAKSIISSKVSPLACQEAFPRVGPPPNRFPWIMDQLLVLDSI